MSEEDKDVDKLAEGLLQAMKEMPSEKSKREYAEKEGLTGTNFTWEHFFVHHCGMLEEDSKKYEANLIAHRMNPLDTLLESVGLIVEYGRIPLGDKLKLVKTMKRQEDLLKAQREDSQKAKKRLGLEEYNDFQASIIMDTAKGTSKWEIDYGIEEFEYGMEELTRMVDAALVKDPKARELHSLGCKHGLMSNDPVRKLLESFGYTTFDYTYDKDVSAEISPCTRRTTSSPAIEDLLLGNLGSTEEEDIESISLDHGGMYT